MAVDLAALTPFVVVAVLALRRPAWFGDPRPQTWNERSGRGALPTASDQLPCQGMIVETVSHDERPTEAPLWPGPYCPDCIDGCCDQAEHLGLTDTDIPGGE